MILLIIGDEFCEFRTSAPKGLKAITINKNLGKLGPARSSISVIVSREGAKSYHIGVYY